MLAKVAKVMGSEAIKDYIKKYNIPIKPRLQPLIGDYPGISFNSFIKPRNRKKANHDAVDLIQKMLEVDHTKRILPREAMQHPYFEPVRETKRFEDMRRRANEELKRRRMAENEKE